MNIRACLAFAIAAATLAACGSEFSSSDGRDSQGYYPEEREIRLWLDDLMIGDDNERARAVAGIERMGVKGVPFIVGHLIETGPVKPGITITVGSGDTALTYAPETRHDALAAILNHMTGQHFEDVYDGKVGSDVREKNKLAWENWCAAQYVAQADICRGAQNYDVVIVG